MAWLYLRWTGIVALGLLIAVLGVRRYVMQVQPITPEDLMRRQQTEQVRVLGMVQAGSLTTDTLAGRVTFRLVGQTDAVPVHYTGAPDDAIRELKTLVVVGQWSPLGGAIEAKTIALLPNYDFISAAYLLGLGPIGLFLFAMERRVRLLYTDIRQAKLYEPEDDRP